MKGLPRRAWLPAGAVFALVLLAWGLSQTRGAGIHVDTSPPGSESASTPSSTGGTGDTGFPGGAFQPPLRGQDPGTNSLPDFIEAQAGQLTDILSHLRLTCAAATPPSPSGRLSSTALSKCVDDAEAAVNVVDILRGSIQSPAGAAMPGDVRKRWDDTLAEATATVTSALTPLWDSTGRVLASGRESPEEVQTLGHLRDRIGRVLSQLERP
jgi:hypothetical protein